MKKSLLFSVVFLTSILSYGSVNLGLDVGVLGLQNGNALPNGDLILLIASHSGVWAPLTPGNYVAGDNVIVDAFASNSNAGPGETTHSSLFNYGLINGINFQAGDSLAIVWFPSINFSSYLSLFPLAGTSYGTFTSPTDQSGQGIAWIAPADGTTLNLGYGLNMWTVNTAGGGTIPAAAGKASLTVVPEPSSVALLAAGASLLAGAMLRRRKLA